MGQPRQTNRVIDRHSSTEHTGSQLTNVELAVLDAAMAEEMAEELGLYDDPAMAEWLQQRRMRSPARWPYP